MATQTTFDIGTDASFGLVPGGQERLEGDGEETQRVMSTEMVSSPSVAQLAPPARGEAKSQAKPSLIEAASI